MSSDASQKVELECKPDPTAPALRKAVFSVVLAWPDNGNKQVTTFDAAQIVAADRTSLIQGADVRHAIVEKVTVVGATNTNAGTLKVTDDKDKPLYKFMNAKHSEGNVVCPGPPPLFALSKGDLLYSKPAADLEAAKEDLVCYHNVLTTDLGQDVTTEARPGTDKYVVFSWDSPGGQMIRHALDKNDFKWEDYEDKNVSAHGRLGEPLYRQIAMAYRDKVEYLRAQVNDLQHLVFTYTPPSAPGGDRASSSGLVGDTTRASSESAVKTIGVVLEFEVLVMPIAEPESKPTLPTKGSGRRTWRAVSP